MFGEVVARLKEEHPNLQFYGEHYVPPQPWPLLSQMVTLMYIAIILLIVGGDPVFAALDMPTPETIVNARESLVSSVFLVWMVGNTISHNLLNSGAFEVEYNNHPVWSKIETGRVPTWPELIRQFEEAGLHRRMS
mmetsp:Transcript_118399/g.166409  ORF Transcript_118399/g.166409 Transcript_118399/m.166409 type:complete len:135 (+) Transcript_118399:237-641(+)